MSFFGERKSREVLKVWCASQSVIIPQYATRGSAGLDLCADISFPMRLDPVFAVTSSFLFPTGIHIEIPAGHEGQVRPRSGLAAKHGITMINGIGTIDSDYRGEIKVPLINLGLETYTINPGDRIAQLVIAPITRVDVYEVSSLSELGHTERGEGGFGSTGR